MICFTVRFSLFASIIHHSHSGGRFISSCYKSTSVGMIVFVFLFVLLWRVVFLFVLSCHKGIKSSRVQRKICIRLTTISLFFTKGSYVLTCKAFNINVAASPVRFVPGFNCCAINFCRHTNPNFALKFELEGCQKMRNFGLNTYILQRKICVRLITISLFLCLPK